jgi:DNA-directed RNA polymerase subunit beta'
MFPRRPLSRKIDCGTIDGIWVESLVEGGEILQRVGERILGRVASDDIEDPVTGDVLVPANEAINEEEVELIEKAGIEKVRIRSVLTCEARRGVCKKCYGRDLAHGHEVNLGEAVGVIAAQSIGEPGTQLTMRTFHIGGTASRRVEQSTILPRNPGEVKFIDLKTVENAEGDLVAMNRNGEMAILGKGGREVERYPIIYGASLKVRDGQKVEPSQVLAEWDPFTIPILTEVPGYGEVRGCYRRSNHEREAGHGNGKISRVIVESREADVRPRISIKDSSGKQRIFREVPKPRAVICCRWGRSSWSMRGIPWAPERFWPKSLGKPPKPRILQAVCPVWRSFLKCGNPRKRPLLPKLTVWYPLERIPKANEK